MLRKLASRQKDRVLDATLDDQFASGRLLACISVAAGPERPRRRLHPRGRRARVLQEKLDVKKDKKHRAFVGRGYDACGEGVAAMAYGGLAVAAAMARAPTGYDCIIERHRTPRARVPRGGGGVLRASGAGGLPRAHPTRARRG